MSVYTNDQVASGQNGSSTTSRASNEQSNGKRDPQNAAAAEQIIASIANHPEIRSQLEILQRTVTLVFWYKPNTEPLRLQQMIPTFPFLQLSRLTTLTADLGLTPSSYLDTFNRDSRQWDQHTIESVRVVDGQHRLLYRLRKSLLDGLTEDECLGLQEEVENQLKPRVTVSSQPNITQPTPQISSGAISAGHEGGADDNRTQVKSPSLKRPAPSALDINQPTKILVMEGPQKQQQPYPAYLSAPASNETTSTVISAPIGIQSPPAVTQEQPASPSPDVHMTSPSPSDTGVNGTTHSPYYNNLNRNISQAQYIYQAPMTYSSSLTTASTTTTVTIPTATSTATSTSSASASATAPAPPSPASSPLPAYLIQPQSSAPLIPYHPHPPLKRWPNDYTVASLSAGFRAMEALVQQAPAGGAPMTQRAAFERVFGSRYVKSTVCRHRGVWRKAPQSLREEFEALGEDERACWGEFVRRVEGRPPGRVPVGTTPVHEAGIQPYGQQVTMQGPGVGPNGVTSPAPQSNGVTMVASMPTSNGVVSQVQHIPSRCCGQPDPACHGLVAVSRCSCKSTSQHRRTTADRRSSAA
ncbi:hypothetical protein HGRIS_009070 [Hohenbuehelia grisea]|uniref:Uncharacterized protein n=1 Tax=Hohenbuehelia grisea TaxID=104357 RepID=A0ABR3J009_9AGAR